MTVIQLQPPDSPVRVTPPRLRVLARRVVAGSEGEPAWSQPYPAAAVEPRQLRWGANGRLTTLTLDCRLGVGPGRTAFARAEQDEPWPTTGDQVELIDDSPEPVRWFTGHVGQESILIQSNPDAEHRRLVAYGPELRLRARAVHGQWCKTPAVDDLQRTGELAATDTVRDNVFEADLPCVFNLDGRPNASGATDAAGGDAGWRLHGEVGPDEHHGRVFEPVGRTVRTDDGAGVAIEAEYWTAYTALRSMVEYVDRYQVISPDTDWNAIAQHLSDVVLPEAVVEGETLLGAIGRILLPIGFGFCLEPWDDGRTYADGRPRHVLHVFSRHGAEQTGYPPVLADNRFGNVAGDSIDGRIAQVQRLEFLRDSHNVCNDVRVIGDLQRLQVCLTFDDNESTRDLHPAWDTDTHDLADWAVGEIIPEMDAMCYDAGGLPDGEQFLRRYSRAGRENLAYFDVFRTFVWNEDGAYRPLVTDEPDLAALLSTSSYARRPRPVGPTLCRATEQTGSGVLPAYVEIGVVGDDNAWILLPQVKVLTDRAGFTINVPRLDTFYPYANADATLREAYCRGPGKFSLATLLYNALRSDAGAGDYAARFRLIGTIAADTAVTAEAPYQLNSTWPFRSTRIEYRPDRFKLRRVAAGGNPAGRDVIAADDSVAAASHAERIRDVAEDAMGHGSIVLRTLTRSVRPGMAWPRTAGRPVNLQVSAGGQWRSACVAGVTWNFAEGAGKTELTLDSPLLQVSV